LGGDNGPSTSVEPDRVIAMFAPSTVGTPSTVLAEPDTVARTEPRTALTDTAVPGGGLEVVVPQDIRGPASTDAGATGAVVDVEGAIEVRVGPTDGACLLALVLVVEDVSRPTP
jgi:hypothetical protein